MRRQWALVFLLFIFFNCDDDATYRQSQLLKENAWLITDTVRFAVPSIVEGASHPLYITIKHTDGYPYQNLWVKYSMVQNGKSITTQRVDMALANRESVWNGKRMGSTYTYKQLADTLLFAETAGNSSDLVLKFNHIMRPDTLQGIKAVGVVLD